MSDPSPSHHTLFHARHPRFCFQGVSFGCHRAILKINAPCLIIVVIGDEDRWSPVFLGYSYRAPAITAIEGCGDVKGNLVMSHVNVVPLFCYILYLPLSASTRIQIEFS
jgi:hypothetical protein